MRSKINKREAQDTQQALMSLHNIKWTDRIELDKALINAGDCLHILGANGAGKSSLLALMAGIESPEQGEILLNQSPITEHSLLSLSKKRCFLPQQQTTEFDIPIEQLLSFYSQQNTKSNHEIIDELEDYLQLNQFLHKPLSRLSGGQQQRFHIARVLVQVWPAILRGEAIIILDEPLAQLDINYQQKVLRLLSGLCAKGNTVMMSCHDINLSTQFATKAVLLKHGKMLLCGEVKRVLSKEHLAKTYDCEFSEIIDIKTQQKYLVNGQSSFK